MCLLVVINFIGIRLLGGDSYATLSSPLIVTFTYSGQITYLEQIIVTMTLHANGYRYNLDETDAVNQLAEDVNNLSYNF